MKAIEKRGRTFDALVHPNHYAPFAGIVDGAAFDAAWQQNRDWIFANMAHAAYCDQAYLKTLFKTFAATIKFYRSHPDEDGIIRGRQAFLAVWDDKAILSFRGTEGGEQLAIDLGKEGGLSGLLKLPFIPTDIIDDLDFLPDTYTENGGESQVHRGFFKATQELWPEIHNDLKALSLPDPDQVFVTGHSLGAAMAVIAAVLYSFKQVVTFGEPSVGNDLDHTITSACSHLRYVNGHDPVTKIVPEWLYKHHGELKGIVDINGPDPRYDHSIINYVCILATHDAG